MASGIASTELVIALGKAGLLGSFGAAGLGASRIEAAIQTVQAALPDGRYAFNLINSPSEEALERNAVALYLKYGVHVIEASAYLDLTAALIHYRVAGLSQRPRARSKSAIGSSPSFPDAKWPKNSCSPRRKACSTSCYKKAASPHSKPSWPSKSPWPTM